MQEWFDELKANYPYMANEIYQKGFEKYLEKEKEQIIEAVEFGLFNMHTTIDGKYYYDLKFNQNK